MNSQLSSVMRRRGELLAKIASQREQVIEIGVRLQAPLAVADQGVAAVHFLRSHPLLIVGVIAALVTRRRGVAGMARVALRVWKGYRYFTVLKAKIPS